MRVNKILKKMIFMFAKTRCCNILFFFCSIVICDLTLKLLKDAHCVRNGRKTLDGKHTRTEGVKTT